MAHLRAYLRAFSVLVIVVLVASQGLIPASANLTPHALCTGTTPNIFSQNWTNAALITTDDNWSGVPSIVGYLGDISAGTTTGVDPRTLTSSALGAVDVIANQANPDTTTAGGVAEFDLTNDVVALQGSGTADAPSLVITLNNTGTSNTTIAYTVRDIDGSPDNTNQQFNVQYRIGTTGAWTNVPGSYIADASVGGSQDTPIAAYALPSILNNAGTVQLRFMTTNAPGADEWLGVDDIVITPTCNPAPCASVTFPYTLPDNTPATLRTAMQCANANGTADIIDFNGQTVTLTEIYGDFDGATGLPRIDSDITLRNGTITRSGVNQFRLLYMIGSGALTLRDMTLSNGGGATYTADAGILYAGSSSSLSIWRSLITGGTVSNSNNVGAIFSSGTLLMVNSRVQGNQAGRAGGMVVQNGPAYIHNSVISGNVATGVLGGGALYIPSTGSNNVTITNSTITGNYSNSTSASASGGIIGEVSGPDIVLKNSIVWGNSNNGGTAPQIVNTSGTTTVTNSIIQGGQFGGLDVDPLFTTPLTPSITPSTAGNFQLLDSSPAVDAGANADVPVDAFDADNDTNLTEDAPDLAAATRRVNDTGVTDTGSGTAPIVDMGAYEKQTNSPDPCAAYVFPYTLTGNTPTELIEAIECANANGTTDTIDLNNQTVTLTDSYASYTGATGLPQITTAITLRNGTITRSGGNQFRLLSVGLSGNLTLNNVVATNGYGLAPGNMGGGGAIYNLGTLNIVGGRFSSNYSALDGGAIHNDGGAVVARYTVFSGNSSNTSLGGVGGGLANSFGSLTLSNVLISGNLAVQGGGVYNNNGGTLTLQNSTIAGNSTNDQGGGLRNENTAASVVLNNTIISGNESSLFPATSDLGGSITNNFSLVGGSPVFVAPLDASATAPTTAGDYRLADGSPAIDAGNNSLVPGIISTDLDNNPRFYNDTGVTDTGSGAAPIVDMGAYEKQTNSTVDPCAAITFPYTLPNNTRETLITAMECANANGTADVIDLNGFTVTLPITTNYATYQAPTGLPQITTNITLRDGTIEHDLSGGGSLFRTFDIAATGTLNLVNVTLLGDSAPNPGGAFYNFGTLNVISSTMTGYSTNNRGGVLFNGSGATANFTNALFYNNNAVNAHVMDNNGSVTIINSTFDKHTSISNFGSILEGSGYVIRNSIFWNPGSGPNQIQAGNTVSDSIVKGGYSGGTNILNTNPLFVNEGADDFRLQLISPAINVGVNSYVPADTFDADGDANTAENTPDHDLNPRIAATIVDMGAYERQDAAPPDPCAAITFPYTLPNNLAATLITAIECANANGASADTIDLNSQIVTLTASYANYTGATGLPQVTTDITLESGVITRSGGAPQFRLLNVASTGSLTLNGITASGGSLSSSDNAGAIFNDGGTLTILNSTITNNSAGFGGAIYNSGAASVITITDSTLSSNSATENGGFMMSDGGSVTILRSTVSGNSASGVVGNGAIYNFEADLDIIETAFINNTSTTSVGAIQNFNGTTNIANSVFTGNSASTNAGAVINNAGGVMTITNSQFTGNSAGNTGGAVFNNVSSTLTVTNSTFAGNNATTSGGIHLASSTATITNSIIWGNSSNTLTGAIITYSVIQGGFTGTGNLNVDPLFVAPVAFASAPTSTGNYRLQDNSPAVDAGSNAAVPVDTYDLNDNASTTDEAPDLASNPRRYDDTGVTDTGAGTAPLVDMGAYEKQTNSPVAFPEDVDYCNLQFPTSFTAAAGSTSPIIYGRVYEDDNGVLTSTPGANASIVGQLGYGPLGSDPRGGNPAWQWFPTTYNVQVGNDDEYQGTFTVPFAATGTQRSYTYRFSVDSGANYTYCDSNGNGTNNGLEFSTANLGTLTISPGGQPTISINDVALNEGNSGTTNFIFTISLNGPSLNPVTFDIVTADNTATVANGDYVANGAADVTLFAGQTSTTFTVVVNGDTTFEPNQTFFVNLINIVGATAGDAQGTGTIVNDDVDPCFAYSFPYTLAGNTPAELIQAINCANLNGPSADTINLNGQTVTLTASYANVAGTNIGLPEITTPITVQNGTITRSSANLFRFFLNNSTLNLNNLTLSNANSQGDGGAIVNSASSVLNINNSRIIGNYGNFGGAIFNSNTGTTTLTNTLVAGNRSNSQGGGIRNRGNLILNNSTVAGNFTTSGAEGGGGIANAGAYTLTLNNSIVYGNESSSFPGANEMVGTFTSNNSLVGVNPSFVAPLDASNTAPTTSGDYRLAVFSVAIDAGDNSLIPGGVTTDLDGNPRRFNDTGVADTGVGTAPIVDLGAYERQTNSVLQADLSITKTDGVTTAVPGGSVTYTITASNAGPSNAPSATVADTFPAILTGTWTCVGAGGGTCTAAGSGNISDTVNLPAGGSVTYTVTATISPSATGTLSNTATVSSGVTDPNPANNSATDTDTLTPQADLSITKTDGVTTAVPGGSVTYTITASNAGPSNVTGATIADTFPVSLTGTWTCVGAGGGTCTAAGSGNISDTVNLPAGGSVTYTVSATISAAATGTLSNTATVSAPGGVTDPTPGNNSATDTDTLTPQADLSITKTDGLTSAVSGTSLTYTIVASNAGPSDAPSATVSDIFSSVFSGVTWTCVGAGGGTCTAAGTGNISDTVNLPAGGSVTYTATATIDPSASGTASNTATVSSAVTDPVPGSNSATDNTTLAQQADVSITKTDGQTNATPGSSVTYTIVASNAGPSQAFISSVTDTFPASLTGVTWTCVGAGGGTCTAAGSGNISESVVLPVGGSVTFTATGTISPSATGTLSNTATVSTAVTDPNPGNNSATDTNTLDASADLAITKTDGVTTATPGGSVTYTITASNAGPSNVIGATIADTFPVALTGTWTCIGAGGGTCTAAGSGNINDTVDLPAGGSVTYTVSATINAAATGTLSNIATVSAPGGVTDPTPGNNSATDTDTLTPQADLAITKTDGVTTATPGGSVIYTITASNAGPSNVTGVTVADTFPASLTSVTWTCVGAGGGTCTAAGSGNISESVVLPVGGSVTFTATGTISLSATGTLSNTATVSSAVTDPNPANNSATDTTTLTAPAGVTVSPTTVSVTEGGATATYGVSLNTQPTSDVTITVAGDAQASASPATLTFTTVNWNVAQNVTVTAVDDLVIEGAHTGTITHSASGGGYTGVSVANVTANITDNDVAAPTNLLLNGGFELGRDGRPDLARSWVVVAPSVNNDIRFCKAAPAPQIYEGTCAFRFSFSGTIVNGTSRSLTQTITAPAVSAGDTLTLTAYVRAANLINRPRLLVRAIYADGTSQRIRINIPEGTYSYTQFTGSVTLTGTPTSIRVIVQPRTSEGVFFVDGMSLEVNATPPTRTSAPDSGLLSLPPAP